MSEEYVSVLDRLPCKFGRNDEELNIEIAEEICAEENAEKKCCESGFEIFLLDYFIFQARAIAAAAFAWMMVVS